MCNLMIIACLHTLFFVLTRHLKAWQHLPNNDIYDRQGHISMVTTAGHMPGADY